MEKQRSYSVQMDNDRTEEPPIPKMRRAETMPYQRHKETAPEKGSRLRNTAYPTPETSPERQQPSSRKFDYGQSQAYADDVEYASPDGYEVPASSRYATEEVKPQRATSHRRERYAEPAVAKDARGRQRSSSKQQGSSTAQPPPMPTRTSSTQYFYRDGPTADPHVHQVRPGLTRESSSRAGQLYGEVPTTTSRSPGNTRARYSPPAAEPSYTRSFAAEPLNMQTGYKTKERPSLYRRETSKQAVR